jgi:SHS2 domain-containing protein
MLRFAQHDRHQASSNSPAKNSPNKQYNSAMPYEEIPHTADWSLRVWATDHAQLFTEAARGMNTLAGILLAKEPRLERSFTVSGPDAESLLVSFLSELVYYAEQEKLAFDRFNLQLVLEKGKPCQLAAILTGAPILSLNKTIKAVTYHNLNIRKSERGVEVEIVFDV